MGGYAPRAPEESARPLRLGGASGRRLNLTIRRYREQHMRCFNHSDREAVGTCKACSRGLCSECAVDLGHGLSCRGGHEATVESYRVMLDRNTKALDAAPVTVLIGPIFIVAIGLLMGVYGLISSQGTRSFAFIIGCAFTGFGVIAFVRNRSAYSWRRPKRGARVQSRDV